MKIFVRLLGITYNQVFKELYWTSGRAIMAGLLTVPSKPTRVLFNLNSTKNLLYLKYDRQNEAVYVSTLNNIYACFIAKNQLNNCKVLVNNFNSARGLHFDPTTSYLYAADHKLKSIKKVFVGENLQEMFDNNTWNTESATTVIDSSLIASIGDIFYLCLHKSTLLWTEFSGRVKATNLKTISSNYEVLLRTNEYVYAVAAMDNSTYDFNYEMDGFEKSEVDDYADMETVVSIEARKEVKTTSVTTIQLPTAILSTTTESVDQVTEMLHKEAPSNPTAVVSSEAFTSTTMSPRRTIFNALYYDHSSDVNPRAETNSASNIQVNLNKQKVSSQNVTSNSANARLIDAYDGSSGISAKSPFMISLYIISGLFGLSLFVNLIFFYITNYRNRRSTNSNVYADLSEKQNLRNETGEPV
jgi:hypothetical protein